MVSIAEYDMVSLFQLNDCPWTEPHKFMHTKGVQLKLASEIVVSFADEYLPSGLAQYPVNESNGRSTRQANVFQRLSQASATHVAREMGAVSLSFISLLQDTHSS